MTIDKTFLVHLAKAFLAQCRNGDTEHAHGLDKLILNKHISFEELDLEPTELQTHLLHHAHDLAMRCKAHADVQAAVELNSMLQCNGQCKAVVTCVSAEISPIFLDILLRKHALQTVKALLDGGTEADLLNAMNIIREYKLTHLEIDLDRATLSRLASSFSH
ncbi:MAG: hypothetical protein WCT54_03090 [Patescibacteria group bacterium]|jgi:hypothetical protein